MLERIAGSARSRRLAAAILVASAIALAWSGARTDSVTVDEPSHLVAGFAALHDGDYRLSPDHPPLGRMLLALPLLAQPVEWRAAETEAWRRGDFLTLGRLFLGEWNDGQRLIRASRAVAIVGLVALLAAIAVAAHRLFGPLGALLALALAAFDPALLAHGRLATLDVPFAASALATLLAAERWLSRPGAGRLAWLVLALAAAALVKFSWVVLLPVLLGMGAFARVLGCTPASARQLWLAPWVLALGVGLAIWAAYGFRWSAARGADAATATMAAVADLGRPVPSSPAAVWEAVFHDSATGVDRPGPVVPLLRTARSLKLLPEAYLYGLAFVDKKAEARAAYLRGQYAAAGGFPSYFAWAYAVKTPLPEIALVVAALVALVLRRGLGSPTLAVGLGLFAVLYTALLVTSGLNLGYRHLLPATTMLAVSAGSLAPPRLAAPWRRSVELGVVAALSWLALGTWWASPHLLGYFNEAAGGWRRGHLVLADSNLDWAQDLLRLRERLASPSGPGETTPVWLAQAGDPPLPRDLAVRRLLGHGAHAPSPGTISGGWYVVSATELLGVYRPLARAATWRDGRLLAQYESLAHGTARDEAGEVGVFEALRRFRLVSRLARREPDERIGTSLFVFRITGDEVAEATAP